MSGYFLKKIICAAMVFAVLAASAAQAQTEVKINPPQKYSSGEIAQMLAPVALYPDALLSQIFIAATYPFEVAEAERWMAKNAGLSADALDKALSEKNWNVSVLSLCHYPKILTMMSENLSWAARLGDAFVHQQQEVLDMVQELRERANSQGNLNTTGEQKVIVEEKSIRIEPVAPNYIYVPVYDPNVVYGQWWHPAFPPLTIFYPGVTVSVPGIVFSPRLFVGFGVFGWSSFSWPERRVVIVHIDRTKRFYRHAHAYGKADRFYWRPDWDRRPAHDRRAGEIPRFHPPSPPPKWPPDRERGREALPDGRRHAPPPSFEIDKRPKAETGTPGRDATGRPDWRRGEKDAPQRQDKRGAAADDWKKSETGREREGRDGQRLSPPPGKERRQGGGMEGGRGGVSEEKRR